MKIKEESLNSSGRTPMDPRRMEQQLEKIASGDKEAFAQLYDESKAAMYFFLLSYLNKTDAEDALQDTYIAVFQCAGTYQAKGTPQAWLFGIGKNKALMKLRSLRRETVLPEEDWARMESKTPGLSVEDKLVLHDLLQTLSEEEYRIVVLHAATGLKFREIASISNLPLSTALSKYHRAMKKLKNSMKGEDWA